MLQEVPTKMGDFVLRWDNLSVWATEKKQKLWSTIVKKKEILIGVSGEATNGSLVAIMGSSGAGKTTLLASLSGRITEKQGTITKNQRVLTDWELKRISGYVHQQDIVIDSLTVNEHLQFMSFLKLRVASEERKGAVDYVIFSLNLQNCGNTIIRLLSGGERKRLSLAVELLSNPDILFCDEPTTGLDSCSTTNVIKELHNKAKSGKLVIITIHQPSSAIFNYFDEIVLLSSGRLVCQGNQHEVANVFNSVNLICPRSYNPADFYINCIQRGLITPDSVSMKVLEEQDSFFMNFDSDQEHYQKKKTIFFAELYWLTWRAFIDMNRNKSRHLLSCVLLSITAAIFSSVYSAVSFDDPHNVQNVRGILYFLVTELVFTHMYIVLNTFPSEFVVCLREKSLYSSSAYFLSKLIESIPRNLVNPFVYLLIFFVSVRYFSGVVMFIQIFAILVATCVCATAFGLCISATFETFEMIELFTVPLELVLMLMSGILLNVRSLPSYCSWIKYISPFFYSYESISVLYWTRDSSEECSRDRTTVLCSVNGTQLLYNFGFSMEESIILWNTTSMTVLTVSLCIIGYLGIVMKRFRYNSY